MMISKCDFSEANKLVGGHVSIAGGIDLAPKRAAGFGFNTFQIFVQVPGYLIPNSKDT